MRYPVVSSIAGQAKADALEQMALGTLAETKVPRRAGTEARKSNYFLDPGSRPG